jgi:sugar phosphate permease
MSVGAPNGGRVFYGWWIVGACVLCLSANPGPFLIASLGLFVIPFGMEFGWDRAEISLAATLFTVSSALFIPLLGQLTDRYGSRRVIIPSLFMMGVGLAAITVAVSELIHLYLLFTLLGFMTAGANSLPYLRTVSLWFDRRRGLALGIAMLGTGLGFAYVPPLVQFAMDSGGWRAGYLVLAAICVMVALPIVWLVIRESPASMGLQVDGRDATDPSAAASTGGGVTRAQAIRSRPFWVLAVMFALISFCLFGLLPHLVPMLHDRGMSAGRAALVAATIGMAAMPTRLVIGFLLDRVFGPYVAFACMLIAATGLALLASDASGVFVFTAAALIGVGIGAELDLLAYLVGRYFGLKSFGRIYGLLFAAFLLGSAFGPYGYGTMFEASGSYKFILLVCTGMTAAAGVMSILLPRYPTFAHE